MALHLLHRAVVHWQALQNHVHFTDKMHIRYRIRYIVQPLRVSQCSNVVTGSLTPSSISGSTKIWPIMSLQSLYTDGWIKRCYLNRVQVLEVKIALMFSIGECILNKFWAAGMLRWYIWLQQKRQPAPTYFMDNYLPTEYLVKKRNIFCREIYTNQRIKLVKLHQKSYVAPSHFHKSLQN